MKKACLLLFCCLCIALISQAQDVITLVNGRIIHAKVVQVTPGEIIYKDSDNPGQSLAVMKSGVATLEYANGSKTIYNLTGDAVVSKKRGPVKDNGRVHGIYFGAAGAFGVGTVTSSDLTYSVGTLTCGGVNFLATPMIGQHFGIQFGIGAEGYGYHVNYNDKAVPTFAGLSNTYAQRYFNMPVRLLYLSNSKRRTGFYANGGVDFSILVSATDGQNDFLLPYYRDILISPYISCGVVFRNSNARGVWMLGPFYKASVTDIYSGQPVHYEGGPFMGAGNSGNFTSMGVTLSFMGNLTGVINLEDEEE